MVCSKPDTHGPYISQHYCHSLEAYPVLHDPRWTTSSPGGGAVLKLDQKTRVTGIYLYHTAQKNHLKALLIHTSRGWAFGIIPPSIRRQSFLSMGSVTALTLLSKCSQKVSSTNPGGREEAYPLQL